MKSLHETSISFNKRGKVNFEGGLLSNSGLLLYKEFDKARHYGNDYRKNQHHGFFLSSHTLQL